ncbi:hypothetical protein [Actinomadura parmotrematis]|uniref:DUF3040 domain-containing protein n=1 Tax=Actinomadura parmotrematis TaxID=2864039 RepID=A0ABS7FT12_9ACTN|nr:hypothetical protein [Actinomadura parmotrematis]MBW8483545.1 hypothetical protein [Actinomadura parmotrematis]
MTTGPHDELGEVLRRALNAEADQVSPSPGGLERIRGRIDDRRRARWPGWEWFTATWGRPVLAVGAAVVIAGIGVSAPQTLDIIQAGGSGSPDHGRQSGPVQGGPPSQGVPAGTQSAPGHGPDAGASRPTAAPSPTSSSGGTACPSPTAKGPSSPSSATAANAHGKSGSCPTPTAAPTSAPPATTPPPQSSTSPTPAPTTDQPTATETPSDSAAANNPADAGVSP